jgi:hypothetical protein
MEDESYNIWYRTKEINDIMYVIKRLFAEQSQVWRYDELHAKTMNPPFDTSFNTALIDEKNFKICLRLLLDAKKFDILKVFMDKDSTVKSLFNHVNKYIYISGSPYTIIHSGGYYIMVPVQTKFSQTSQVGLLGISYANLNDKVVADIGTWRDQDIGVVNKVNITDVINTSNLGYNDMKQKFSKTYINVPTKFMPYSFEIYHLDFHVRLIQDCISYMFEKLTNPSIPNSEFHNLYIKMLYFYDHLDMIIFASYITESDSFSMYKGYVSKSKKQAREPAKKTKSDKYIEFVNPLLINSIYKTSGESNFNPDNINKFIEKHQTVSSNMLPVGYSMEPFKVKLYDPVKLSWITNTPQNVLNDLMDVAKEKENDIIIGFTDRAGNSLSPKFKVREPIHKIIKTDDIRMLKTGMVCEYKLRKEIIEISESLGIVISDKEGIKEMCEKIKLELEEQKHWILIKSNRSNPI